MEINEMKYYEVNEPYYALIMAREYDEVMKIYVDVVADDWEGTLFEKIKEVDSKYAIARFSRIPGEGGKSADLLDVLDTLNSGVSQVLIIDGSLV